MPSNGNNDARLLTLFRGAILSILLANFPFTWLAWREVGSQKERLIRLEVKLEAVETALAAIQNSLGRRR